MSDDLEPTLPAALRLDDWALIRAQGPDARSFLQSQLTQDVLNLPVGQARPAGWCSAKGRLLASFVVWPLADDELLLACSADLAAATRERLAKFVLRAKCRLTDASADGPLWGWVGDRADRSQPWAATPPWQVLAEGASRFIGLPAVEVDGRVLARGLLMVGSGDAPPAWPSLARDRWLALEALSGVARIVAATAEQFVPQMVNLELVGGVDFRKGCYPGQEVVARSQYRGTLKRRAFVARCSAPLAPAQELFHDADPSQPAGMVVIAGQWKPGRTDALVELKLGATAGGRLHAGAPDGPLVEIGSLPYEVPREAA